MASSFVRILNKAREREKEEEKEEEEKEKKKEEEEKRKEKKRKLDVVQASGDDDDAVEMKPPAKKPQMGKNGIDAEAKIEELKNCGICGTRFVDPLLHGGGEGACGVTYCRSCLMDWVPANKTCPNCRNACSMADFVQNRILTAIMGDPPRHAAADAKRSPELDPMTWKYAVARLPNRISFSKPQPPVMGANGLSDASCNLAINVQPNGNSLSTTITVHQTLDIRTLSVSVRIEMMPVGLFENPFVIYYHRRPGSSVFKICPVAGSRLPSVNSTCGEIDAIEGIFIATNLIAPV